MRAIVFGRRYAPAFAFAAVALALCWQLFILGQNVIAAFEPIRDWGLAYGQEGTQPRGNVDARTLAKDNALYVGNDATKVLYLTFDAGYENGYMTRILDTLKRHNVRAAFFLVGHYIKTNGDLVCRMTAEGHIVGNHTKSHSDMSKISDPEDFKKELTDLEDMFFEATGTSLSKFYRPPEGRFCEENLRMAKSLGYTTVFWSLAYADWDNNSQPSHEFAFSKLVPRTHNGAVVLLHATSRTNAEILDGLLTRWEQSGYRFGTLEELRCEVLGATP